MEDKDRLTSLDEDQLNRLARSLGASIAEAVVEELEKSEKIIQLNELLDALQSQLSGLHQVIKNFSDQGMRRTTQQAETRPPVLPSMANNSPASLIRKRTKTVSRPTVSYRSNPRRSRNAGQTCSEPGCERPARSRGLCSKHYQRMRYRERKIEAKQTSADPLPPPPAQQPAPASGRDSREEGGTRGIFATLYADKGRKVLASLINQLRFNRRDLVERLNEMYAGMPGVPLEEDDVIRTVHYHHLGDALQKREGEIVCRQLTKQRGSMGKTAQKMKLSTKKLSSRIEELGLIEETLRIRNRFKEEILEKSSFSERLDLALTKEKYLEDLGIENEVDRSLRRELDEQLERLSLQQRENSKSAICEALSLDSARYRRLVRRFGLDDLEEKEDDKLSVERSQ